MTQLSLTQDDATALAHALTTYLSDLRMEISATDGYEMREALKQQEATLTRILLTLRGEEAPGGAADGSAGHRVPLM